MMYIGESTEKEYADLVYRGVVNKENLVSYIQECEECSYEDAKEISLGVLDLLD